ncbi:hypothetical protein PMI03_00595 [Rhizobium sp. AP16]|nr:hypothetical protein PMI03_00595 [Rhizobium sp. AP16]
MSMTYSDHEIGSVFFDPIDNEMDFERMVSDRRRNLFSLTRHLWISCNQVKHHEQFVMISPSMCGSEHADALFGNRNNVLFRFDKRLKRITCRRASFPRVRLPRQKVRPSTGCQHHF